MLKADPEFILGNCLKLALDFFAAERSIKTDSTFKDDLKSLEEMTKKNPNVTKRELKHADALLKYSIGEFDKAFLVWESILLGEHCLTSSKQTREKIAKTTLFFIRPSNRHACGQDTQRLLFHFWHESSAARHYCPSTAILFA